MVTETPFDLKSSLTAHGASAGIFGKWQVAESHMAHVSNLAASSKGAALPQLVQHYGADFVVDSINTMQGRAFMDSMIRPVTSKTTPTGGMTVRPREGADAVEKLARMGYEIPPEKQPYFDMFAKRFEMPPADFAEMLMADQKSHKGFLPPVWKSALEGDVHPTMTFSKVKEKYYREAADTYLKAGEENAPVYRAEQLATNASVLDDLKLSDLDPKKEHHIELVRRAAERIMGHENASHFTAYVEGQLAAGAVPKKSQSVWRAMNQFAATVERGGEFPPADALRVKYFFEKGPVRNNSVTSYPFGDTPPARDLYTALGLKADASDAEVNSAYRKLAAAYHPDTNGAQYVEKFKEAALAYEILGDRNRRALYDGWRPVVWPAPGTEKKTVIVPPAPTTPAPQPSAQ